MNADPSATQGNPAAGAPSEEELRAAYEAELARISATDMIAQATVSLLNIGAHRMGGAPAAEGDPPVGQDLEQARDAIDGASALLEILERRIPGELTPLRDALSRLQMAYATESSRAQAPAAAAPGPDAEQPAAGTGFGRAAHAAGLGAAGRAARTRSCRVQRAPLGAGSLNPAARRPEALLCARSVYQRAFGRRARYDAPAFAPDYARAEQSEPASVRAKILARHSNQTAEDFS